MQTAVTSAPLIGVPGQLATLQSQLDGEVISGTSEEASTSIPFGRFVVAGTEDEGVKLPAAQEDLLYGVVVFAQAYAKSDADHVAQLDANGLTPGTTFGCLRRGEIIVVATTAVTPADEVHVQMETSATPNTYPLGSVRKTAEVGKTVDITPFAQWRTSAGAGELAVLFVDLNNRALVTSDS